jgi:hypothetical protein
MRDLHSLAAPSTPAYLTVWWRGGGTLAARRQRSDSGSIRAATVPSAKGLSRTSGPGRPGPARSCPAQWAGGARIGAAPRGRGVERACARGRVERKAIHGGAARLVVGERFALGWPEAYRPLGSGRRHLARDPCGSEAAREIASRLVSLFLPDERRRRPCHGDDRRYAEDARHLALFHEYFHGDTGRGLGGPPPDRLDSPRREPARAPVPGALCPGRKRGLLKPPALRRHSIEGEGEGDEASRPSARDEVR